jgi:phosphate starvation-inducible PhoH-like protein
LNTVTADTHPHSLELELGPVDNQRLANLAGPLDGHLRQLERRLGVEINNRGSSFQIIGTRKSVDVCSGLLESLYELTKDEVLTTEKVHLYLQDAGIDEEPAIDTDQEITIKTKRGVIKGRSPNQRLYLRNILTHDICFGIGPAGTGKTYLAVACAIEALEQDKARRLVLVRPAVEAGERLGFLPGDLVQKVDPYLRPLFDALYDMLGFERVAKYIERNVIEVAP